MTVKWPKCMAILLTKGALVGFEFHRCLHVHGALLSVEPVRRHPQTEFCQSTERADHTYLDIGATLSVQATSWQMEPSLFDSNQYPQVMVITWLHGWALLPLPCYGATWATDQWFGFHRCLHIQGCFATCGTITETPSNCSLLFARTGWPHLPWHCCNPKRSSNMLPDGAFLVLFYWIFSGDSLYDYTAGRCCLYRAMVRVIYLYVVYPTHCHARLGEQYNCDSIQVTINGATSRCQWACHQCLLNTLASYVFWSPPIVVHHWGCRLASLHRGSCNPWCPRAPKSYVHLPAQRKALGSLSGSGGLTAVV